MISILIVLIYLYLKTEKFLNDFSMGCLWQHLTGFTLLNIRFADRPKVISQGMDDNYPLCLLERNRVESRDLCRCLIRDLSTPLEVTVNCIASAVGG